MNKNKAIEKERMRGVTQIQQLARATSSSNAHHQGIAPPRIFAAGNTPTKFDNQRKSSEKNVSGYPKTYSAPGTDPTKHAVDARTVMIAASGARTVLATAAQIEMLPKCDSVIGVDMSQAATLAENAVTMDFTK